MASIILEPVYLRISCRGISKPCNLHNVAQQLCNLPARAQMHNTFLVSDQLHTADGPADGSTAHQRLAVGCCSMFLEPLQPCTYNWEV